MMILQSLPTVQPILTILGVVFAFVVAIGVVGYLFWKGVKSAQRQATADEQQRIVPHEKAAEGWRSYAELQERRAQQVEAELSQIRERFGRLRKEHDELLEQCQNLSRVNMRLTGDLEAATRRLVDAERRIGDLEKTVGKQ